MGKLRMHTISIIEENIEKIGRLFPNCIVESLNLNGESEVKIDFDILKKELSEVIIDSQKERYQFNWPDKNKAIFKSNVPTSNTLRPCREESVNFDQTENLYIEGDNLEVLKLLREDYLGKIKMIYIDPPYNTGGDFVYKDNFTQSISAYREVSGLYDESGNILFHNTDRNGRFHTDWLNMMYPRLKISRDLLQENGVILISIDDNEVHNLRKICDEIYGEVNFIAQCVRKRRDSQANLSKNISPIHEYIVIYAKTNGDILNKVSANIDENDYHNLDNDPRGPYKTMPCTNKGGAVYSVKTPTGKIITEEWRFKKETYEQLLADNRLVFPKGGDGKPRYKLFLSEKQECGVLANTWLEDKASNQEATREIKAIFDNLVFDTPKPIGLLEFCIQLASDKDSIILDFFSGSATTAHAVLRQNSVDGGHRKFIMVQIPERTNEKSDAYKAGYKTICEIGKERIRRAGKKIEEELATKKSDGVLFSQGTEQKPLDTGFRVLKLDTSNMQDVYYKPEDSSKSTLFEDNVKPDRSSEDLLFQVMLECNLPLSAKIEKKTITGKEVFNVNDGYLVACFDTDVNETIITEVAKQKPYYFVMRDASLSSDNVADNFEQIFNAYSKDTIRKIL